MAETMIEATTEKNPGVERRPKNLFFWRITVKKNRGKSRRRRQQAWWWWRRRSQSHHHHLWGLHLVSSGLDLGGGEDEGGTVVFSQKVEMFLFPYW